MSDEMGLGLNVFGTLVAIWGLFCNAMGNYVDSYNLWIISDILLICMFWGVYRKWWKLNGGALLQVGLYMVFLIVGVAGRVRLGR